MLYWLALSAPSCGAELGNGMEGMKWCVGRVEGGGCEELRNAHHKQMRASF